MPGRVRIGASLYRGGLEYEPVFESVAAASTTSATRPVRGDRSYLMTGGLGQLGRSLAQWFVDRGAGTVILAGRRAPGPADQRFLDELRRRAGRAGRLA